MNNTNNTEELLKTIDLTLDDVYNIIKEGVKSRYKSFKDLRSLTTPDDMTQEVLLYYLSTMKSTGDIRLNHYIKKYQDRQHIINLIKQTSYQLPIYLLRSKEAINKSVSLSLPLRQFEGNTLEDMIADNQAEQAIYSNITDKELTDLLRDELNTLNIYALKQKYNSAITKKYNEYNLPFLLDTANMVKAYNRTLVQLQIVKDLCAGYSKSFVSNKYKTYKEDIEIIKTAFLGKLNLYLRASM